MLFRQFNENSFPLSYEPPSKITYSQGTDTSQPQGLSKQISLCSCPSALSLPELAEHQPENQLFARYLFASGSTKQRLAWQEMNNYVSTLFKQGHEQVRGFEFYKQDPKSEEQLVLEHFIQKWLVFMGYGSSGNKKYYISRMKALGGLDQTHILIKIYKNLALLNLQRNSIIEFLLSTCRNGWQYFARQIYRMVCQSKERKEQSVRD